MSLTPTRSGRAKARVLLLVLALVALGVGACGEDGLFTPNKNARTLLQLHPSFAVMDGASAAAAGDINFIRLTIKVLPNGPVTVQDTVVNPNDAAWAVNVEVDPNTDLQITIELINKVGASETTLYSGQVQVSVGEGEQQQGPAVQVFPGPPENLGITSVTISPRDQSVLEGSTINLSATVAPTVANPVLVWSSLNSAVATVDASGVVTAKAPGQAVIDVFAGTKQDHIAVTVGARATHVEVTATPATLTSIGADATVTARVLDVRDNVVPGVSATFTVADSTIATQVSPGVFRARKNGTTTITATAVQAGQTVTGTATLTVQQNAVSVTIDPGSRTFHAVGQTQAFSASAKDANNAAVSGVAFNWSSSDATVASVDANGVVTAHKNGTATIRVEAGGGSAEATVTVSQVAATLSVDPASVTLTFLGDHAKLTATAKDSNGVAMDNAGVTWVSSAPNVVSVDAAGNATAVSDGTALVTAISGSLRAGAGVTVHRTAVAIRLNEDTFDVAVGETKQLTATPVDAGGSSVNAPPVTWRTSDSSVATVSTSGLVTGMHAGHVTITADAVTVQGSAQVTVTTLSPPSLGNGLLAGRVVTRDMTPISGASVTFSHGSQTFTVTTDISGNYISPPLAAGSWDVTASDAGFVATTFHGAQVVANSTVTVESLILVPASTFPGTISGTVRNARTTAPIGSATVELRVGQNVTAGPVFATTTADAGGYYSISNLPAQVYTVTARASGYGDGFRTGIVVGATTLSGQDVLLTPIGSPTEMYIVLTWGEVPRDLDSHLIVPGFASDVAYYNRGNLTSAPFAQLDIDDTSGFGPETITITQVLPGRYTYYVYNYSGSPLLETASAKVEVFRGSTRIATFDVPNEAGRIWTVFTMDGTTIVPINHVSDGVETSAAFSRPMPFQRLDTVQRMLDNIREHPKTEIPEAATPGKKEELQ